MITGNDYEPDRPAEHKSCDGFIVLSRRWLVAADRSGLPGRAWLEQRARRRVDLLKTHPVAE